MLLVIALLLAGGATWMAKRVVENMPVTAKPETAAVVVAANDIPLYASITADQLKVVQWPKSNLPVNYYSSIGAVVGNVSQRTISTGDVISKTFLREDNGGSPLSALITPSMRAISLQVNDASAVSGFLYPGNRVDVLATARAAANQPTTTELLLQNVKVLAIDQNVTLNKATVGKTVTLEVSPKQAATISSATATGTIQLVLRNPDDTQLTRVIHDPKPPTAPPPVTPKPIVKPPSPPPPARIVVQAAVQPKKNKTIMMLKGTRRLSVNCTSTGCQTPEL